MFTENGKLKKNVSNYLKFSCEMFLNLSTFNIMRNIFISTLA